MPLAQFHDQAIDPEGRPVHVQVTVYYRGTTDLAGADMFTYASGGSKANPFDAPDGFVDFWANPGAYDVKIEDIENVPPLYATRVVGFDAVSGDDGGIVLKQIADDMMRQAIPIGAVIDWWRPPPPAGETPPPVPDGFEICDGSPIAAGDHDFPISGGITLPDLSNVFILGANITKADGAGATGADGPGNAPGIRGTGGSNAPHQHPIPAHYHSRGTLDVAVTGSGAHEHDFQGTVNSGGGGGPTPYFADAAATATGWVTNAYFGHNGAHGHGTALSGNIGATGSGTNGDASFNSGTVDGRPAHYGLLKIMKVRRA